LNVSLTDLTHLSSFAMTIDPQPVRFGGRILGLSPEEQQVVPTWGWVCLGIGVATAAVIVAVPLSEMAEFCVPLSARIGWVLKELPPCNSDPVEHTRTAASVAHSPSGQVARSRTAASAAAA
jgi:hypothetical protein